jgi:hypothetical protein
VTSGNVSVPVLLVVGGPGAVACNEVPKFTVWLACVARAGTVKVIAAFADRDVVHAEADALSLSVMSRGARGTGVAETPLTTVAVKVNCLALSQTVVGGIRYSARWWCPAMLRLPVTATQLVPSKYCMMAVSPVRLAAPSGEARRKDHCHVAGVAQTGW